MINNLKNAIEIKNLSKRYETFKLDNISFTLPKGYVMGLVGTNGAGKTTTIKAIMDVVKADSGELKVFDLPYEGNEVLIKENIGFVYDESPYFDEYSLEKNKKLVAPFYPTWDDEKYRYYIRRFKLNEMMKPCELSKGMKMKFSLAMALSHKAKLLIMDEPTAGLDPIFRSELLDLLFEVIKEEEISILFSSHITSDIEKLADYVTCIDNGTVIFSEEKEQLLEGYSIVKGPKELYTDEIKELLLSSKELMYSFEGLTNNIDKIKSIYGDKLTFDYPTLEEIIVHHIKSSK
ncbi:MAG: ABC transporter ATP-binding protein [Clostridium sp.]